MDTQDGKMKELWEKMHKAEKLADEHEYQKLLDKIESLKNEKESYFKNREGSHPRVRKIEQELAELERKKKMFKDTMDQLAMIGITQDAKNLFLNFPNIEEAEDYIMSKLQGKAKIISKPHNGNGLYEIMTTDAKDDDATEHGSVETYGKEKETETMPLEKDPVQAQDKSNEEIFGKETMTTQEAREYWNKHHNDDPILKDYPNFEAWYRESKRNGYIEDSMVKDSYDMLKLCGIIS